MDGSLVPYGYFGRFGGMMTLVPPEFVPPNQWVDLYNCVIDGGRVTPRPGIVSALDDPLITLSTVQGSLVNPNALVVDTSPSGTASDIIYFTGGTGSSRYIRKVLSDGSSNSTLFTDTAAFTGIDLDTTPSPDLLYVTQPTRIATANADGSGSLTGLITTTGTNLLSLRVWPAQSKIYFTNSAFSSTNNGIWRCTTAGGSETRMRGDTTWPQNFYSCLGIDKTNGYLYAGVYSTIGTPPIRNIRRYTITGSETASEFAASEVTTSIQYRPIAMHYDEVDERLYWIEYDGVGTYYVRSGIPGIYGGNEFFPATFGFNDERTHFIFDSTDEVSGIFNDGGGGILYMARNETSGSIISASSSVIPNNAFWWQRSLIGIESADTVGDVVLVQVRDRYAGGSVMKTWFPSTGDIIDLTPGYTRGTATNAPDLFVMMSRTANPSASDPFIPIGNFSRISCAYMGGGLDSLQGGVLIGSTEGPYVWNYRVPQTDAQNEQQLLYFTGAPTGGTFRLTLNSSETGNITYSTTPATLASNIQTALNTLLGASSVTCAATNFPNIYDSNSPSPVSVTFTGNGYNDRGLPFLYMSTSSLSGGNVYDMLVRRSNDTTTKGRSYPYGAIFLRPAGLPTPSTAPTVSATGSGGPLTGYYEYAISYYSSQLRLESPLSALAAVSFSAQYADVSWTLPSTHYFDDTFSTPRFDGGPIIDKVRVWRRRLGASSSDPTGRDSFYYMVEEVSARRVRFVDRRPDSGTNALDRGRIYQTKAYPPNNCQYVEVHENHAYYADGEPGSRLLWVSNGPYVGGVSGGENGHEYVDASSYYILDDVTANDNQITALKSFGPSLVVWTDSAAFLADTFDVDNGGLTVRRLPNAPGCASHWCVVSSAGLPSLPGGVLIYPNPRGSLYIFDGTEARSSGRDALRPYIDAFSQVTWKNIDLALESIPSWYNASAVLDPRGNRILLTAPLSNGSYETYAYCFDDTGWARWSLMPNLLFLGRETSQDDPSLYGAPTVFMGFGSSIVKLRDGYGDLGAPFGWHALTGKLSADAPHSGKFWGNGIVLVNTHEYTDANTLTVTGYADGRQTFTISQPLPEGDNTIPFGAQVGIARYLQLKFSGTQTDDQDRPEILGYFIWQGISGVDGRVKP